MASKTRRAKRASSIRANNAKGSSNTHLKNGSSCFNNSNAHGAELIERYKKSKVEQKEV